LSHRKYYISIMKLCFLNTVLLQHTSFTGSDNSQSLCHTFFIHLSIHSFQSLFYDRSTASSKASSTQCDIVLPLSISGILSFPKGHPVADHVFFLVFPSLLSPVFPSIVCFWRQFLCKMWPILLACLLFIVYRIHFSSLTLCNTSSFFTWLV
jgi:hypothetical protein